MILEINGRNYSLNLISEIVNQEIDKLLVDDGSRIISAMRYSALSGGKCLRPFLTIITAAILGNNNHYVIRFASALEIIHCYSLIHDDLPAMDNDDVRRGKPSCHKKYDEATAILAGDSLLTIAFEICSDTENYNNPLVQCKIINLIAKSIGFKGMAGGQMLDLFYENKDVSYDEIIKMLNMKTAYLFSVSIEVAAMLSNASDYEIMILKDYGMKIGLAFQIIDDLLDEIGDQEITGKKIRKDANRGKSTLVKKIGIELAKSKADELINSAKDNLKKLDAKFCHLNEVADFILNRNY